MDRTGPDPAVEGNRDGSGGEKGGTAGEGAIVS